jgi:hypothetical protein
MFPPEVTDREIHGRDEISTTRHHFHVALAFTCEAAYTIIMSQTQAYLPPQEYSLPPAMPKTCILYSLFTAHDLDVSNHAVNINEAPKLQSINSCCIN